MYRKLSISWDWPPAASVRTVLRQTGRPLSMRSPAFIAADQLREVAEFVPTRGDPGGQRRNRLLGELHDGLQRALLRQGLIRHKTRSGPG